MICVVTYSFENDNTNTILTAREKVLYDMTDKECEDATQGWEAALHGIKKLQRDCKDVYRSFIKPLLYQMFATRASQTN